MLRKVILVLVVLGTSSAEDSKGDATVTKPPLHKALLGTIDTINLGSKTALDAITSPIIGVNSMGRAILNKVGEMKSRLLMGGTETLKKGVDTAADLAGIINLPVVKLLVTTGSKVVNSGIDTANLIGQMTFKLSGSVVNMTANGIHVITNTTDQKLTGTIDRTARGLSKVVDTVFGIIPDKLWVDKILDEYSAWVQFMRDLQSLSKKGVEME